MPNSIEQRILSLNQNPEKFESIAIELFHYQVDKNPVYKQFLRLINFNVNGVSELSQVPFLPIVFFKTQSVKTGVWNPDTHFQSSGTSGTNRSRHMIQSLSWYHSVCLQIFKNRIGDPNDYLFIGLLPTYLENPHSSLIQMVKFLGEQSGIGAKFCGLDAKKLGHFLKEGRDSGRKILLLSVSYALVHFAELGGFDFGDCLVIETGGMKGLRREMAQDELKDFLSERLGIEDIISEYGMTEMQSQAYSKQGFFESGFSMRAMIRDLENPMGENKYLGRGALNIIDLANWSTCCFLATDDIGEVFQNGTFKVSGRVDSSDIRGCNLLFA